MRNIILSITVVFLFFITACNNNGNESTAGNDSTNSEGSSSSSAAIVNSDYPDRVYWGDQHLHTGWSADAGASGTVLGPEEALRFARGEKVKSNTGQDAQLHRPLDWLCVSDHSDGAGFISGIISGDPAVIADSISNGWHNDLKAGGERAASVMMDIIYRQSNNTLPALAKDTGFLRTVWQRNNAIVEKYNEPGKFTAFIAYEWTSNYGGGNNLHRNIIYRGNKAEADKIVPMTTFVSENPEDLWKWMANYEEKTGGQILAIPHNGNLSNGMMFDVTAFDGSPLTADLAKQRARYEPLFEVVQMKGQSESHPSLSPTDEFSNYELWDRGNLVLEPKKKGMIQHEYLREALKNGLKIEKELGVNPFKYGMAGGTDAHTGLTAAEEDNFFGKFKSSEPSKERAMEDAMKFPAGVVKGWELGAAGRTGVWATSNTREALWDAMKRKEVYATTGSLISVRVFGGFDYSDADLNGADWAKAAYKKGVPMGGDLPAAGTKKPAFLVYALKDPQSGNLDRVQVIKGWLDAKGNTHEKIYNITWSDMEKRKMKADGSIPAVGNTVDFKTATWQNTIGAPELKTVWTDPDFDPTEPAFYYVRVLEIPIPRWTLYDVVKYKLQLPKNVPLTTQERAFTSPIWYKP